MERVKSLMKNWKAFVDRNPDIREAISEGYEVAAYDEETEMIISAVKEDGDLKFRIIEDAHVIPKAA